MTIAAVLTVAVSLSLVGAALLLRQGSANATGTLERGTKVTVWMEPDATKQQINAVKTELAQLNYVVQPCEYWNKARNFSEARHLLPSDVFAGHDAGRDADVLLVHARCARRRGPGGPHLQRDGRGPGGDRAAAGDPQRGDGRSTSSSGSSSPSRSC